MKIKNTLRNIRINIGKLILDKMTYSSNKAIKKILFLRQDGKIGDYIVSSFVFRELKKINPNIFVGVVCTKQQAYLFEQNPYIDQLFLVKKKKIIDYIKIGNQLRQLNFDAVIDPTIFLRNRDLLLLRMIKSKNYVGYKKHNYKIFNLNTEEELHFSSLYQRACELLGYTINDTTYDIPLHTKSQLEIKEYLIKNHINQYIAINFFGANRIKTMNIENIIKYLNYITQLTDKPIILLNYPEINETLKNIAKNYRNVFVHNTKTIFHTIELIRFCEQIISTDTSTIHIASGLNKKIIGIYRDDHLTFKNWKPISKEQIHIIFYKNNINELPCSCIKKDWLVN